MVKYFNYIFIFCFYFFIAVPSTYSDNSPSVSIEVNPKTTTLDEILVLSVIVNGTPESEYPELLGSEEDFDVRLIGPESHIQVINGEVSSQTSFRYQLSPKKEGRLVTPSANVTINGKKYSVTGVPVQILKNNAVENSDEDLEIFAKQTLNKESIYVGEQAVNSLTAYSLPQPVEFNIDTFSYDGFWTQDIGKIEKGSAIVRGKSFTSVKVRKAIFPLKEGNFKLPSRKITLKVRQRMNNARNPLNMFGMDPFNDPFFGQAFNNISEKILRTPEINFNVLPLPAVPEIKGLLKTATPVVGPTSLTLEYDKDPIKFSEGKTIQLTIKSEGNINPLSSSQIEENSLFKVYEETPSSSQYEVAGKLVTEKILKVSIVPQVGGKINIPAFKLQYFDSESKNWEISETKTIEFNVEGGPDKKNLSIVSVDQENPIKDSNLDEAPTPALKYSVESFWEKVSRNISFGIVFLGILGLLMLWLAAKLLISLISNSKRRKILRDLVSDAKNYSQLNLSLRKVINRLINEDSTSFSNDEIKSVIKTKITNSDLIFTIQSALDSLDAAQFSGKSVDNLELQTLKTKILDLI